MRIRISFQENITISCPEFFVVSVLLRFEMSTAEEATINPDGSQSSEIPNEDGADMGGEEEDAFVEPAVDRTLLFLALAAVFAAVFGYIIYSVWKKKKEVRVGVLVGGGGGENGGRVKLD